MVLRRIRAELVGVDVRAITHPDDLAATNAAHEREHVDYLKRYLLPDGRASLCRVSARWLGDYGEARIFPVDPSTLARLDPGDDGAIAAMVALIDRRRRVEAMRYRVRLNKPRRGRDRGEWRLRIRRPDGTDTHELSGLAYTTDSREIAERLAAEREAELNGERSPFRATVGEVLEAYQRWSEAQHSKGTAKYTRGAVRWARLSGLGAVYVDELSRRDVLEARDVMARRLKANTAAGYLRRWRQAWGWALEREVVTVEWPMVRGKRLGPGDRTQKRALTDAEVVDLVAFARVYAEGRHLLLVWALAETGARIGELGAVDCRDFAASGRIRLRETKTRAHRTVWVSPSLAARISAELVRGRSSGPVWTAPRGGKVKPATLGPLMSRWRKERGIEGEVDTHSLRRYAVSRLERAGVAQAAGRRVTGHASSAIYAHYADRGAYDVQEACSALWLPAGHLSPGSVTVSDVKALGSAGDSKVGNSVYSRGILAACGLGADRVPARPSLVELLRSSPCAIRRARSALIQALGVRVGP